MTLLSNQIFIIVWNKIFYYKKNLLSIFKLFDISSGNYECC